MGKTATIHQPDFMPWLGFFVKISKVDEFIVLDHVLNNPRDANFWCRRVKMMVGGKENWISIPLVKNSDRIFIPIHEMQINAQEAKQTKRNLESIRQNYSKAPYFKEVFPLVEDYFNSPSDRLIERNMNFITTVVKLLRIPCEMTYSTTLDPQGSSNEMLIDLLKKRSATKYICGDGAGGYQDEALFGEEGIEVEHNNFRHPEYPQFNSKTFVPGLSIIDPLMNIGFEETADLLRK